MIEPFFPKGLRQRAIDSALALHRRAAERRGRPRRNLPADGKHRDDVRRARPRRRLPAARYHTARHRQASGVQRRRSLLPALRLAGVGYGADLPRAAGGRRRGVRHEGAARARLAEAATGARREGRLGCQAAGRRPGGWAFQYANAHYPDLDDTAVVVMAMDRVRRADGTTNSTPRSTAAPSGSRACKARTAALPPSTRTTLNTT